MNTGRLLESDLLLIFLSFCFGRFFGLLGGWLLGQDRLDVRRIIFTEQGICLFSVEARIRQGLVFFKELGRHLLILALELFNLFESFGLFLLMSSFALPDLGHLLLHILQSFFALLIFLLELAHLGLKLLVLFAMPILGLLGGLKLLRDVLHLFL